MNIYQTWFTLFTFACIDWESSQNDDLINIISDCNPYIWADDGLAADMAAWEDFLEIWGKDDIDKNISIDEAREKLKSFFNIFEKDGFDFGDLNELINKQHWDKYANIITAYQNKDYADKKEWYKFFEENSEKFIEE